MPLVITVIAYPREAGVWKMRLSGLNDHQFTLLKAVNPLLKRKSYGTFLTAKWRTQGAGHGRFIPMPYITPVLNILESWGYTLLSINDVEKHSGLGKIWTFRISGRCCTSPYYSDRCLDTYCTPRWWRDRYNYYHHRTYYPSLAYSPYSPYSPGCCLPPLLPP